MLILERKHAVNKRVTFVVADEGDEESGQNESSSAGGRKRKYFPSINNSIGFI